MKLLIWVLFGIFASLWTTAAWLLVRMSAWVADTVAAGGQVDWVGRVAESPPLLVLADWLDDGVYQWVQDALVGLLQSLDTVLPWLGSALGWLVPFVWVLWGVGVLLMLVLAGGAHLLLGRLPADPAPRGA